MLRLKLREVLERHNLSQADLADAMVAVATDGSHPVSERYLRYLLNNADPLTSENRKRRPSLHMLGLIIHALRHVTKSPIQLEDVIEFVAAPKEARSQGLNRERPQYGNLVLNQQSAFLSAEDIMWLNKLDDLVIAELQRAGSSHTSQKTTPHSHDTRNRSMTKVILWVLASVMGLGAFLIVLRLETSSIGVGDVGDPSYAFDLADFENNDSNLPVPTLIGPEGYIDKAAPVLRIAEVEYAIGYGFYIKNEVSGDYLHVDSPSNHLHLPEGALCPNIPYTWRARALGNDGWTSFSSPITFTVTEAAFEDAQAKQLRLAKQVEVPEAPKLIQPKGQIDTTAPVLEVEAPQDVIGYAFYIRDLQSDRLIYSNHFVETNTINVPDRFLVDGGQYQWNARIRNCHYWSEFSEVARFEVNKIGH